jgi:hypothetical protein
MEGEGAGRRGGGRGGRRDGRRGKERHGKEGTGSTSRKARRGSDGDDAVTAAKGPGKGAVAKGRWRRGGGERRGGEGEKGNRRGRKPPRADGADARGKRREAEGSGGKRRDERQREGRRWEGSRHGKEAAEEGCEEGAGAKPVGGIEKEPRAQGGGRSGNEGMARKGWRHRGTGVTRGGKTQWGKRSGEGRWEGTEEKVRAESRGEVVEPRHGREGGQGGVA